MTKGKIIQIKDFTIPLPDVPDSSADILFAKELPRNQYWRRQEFPKHFYDFNPDPKNGTKAFAAETYYNSDGELKALSEADSLIVQRLLHTENYRRKYGVYMLINGVLQWCSPDYYYNLQWCQMKDLPEKYGRYRRVQNEFLTVYHWCKFVDWITLLVLAKCKKSGVTQIMSGAYLNEGTFLEGAELLMASKEFPNVVDINMSYLFHSFDNLPMIMQPSVKKRNLHEIIFGRAMSAVSKQVSRLKMLNTAIRGQKTKPTCFDGFVLKRGWADELPKWWEAAKVSPARAHIKMIETPKLQQKKNGLLVYTSYMPETDDRGFYEFRDICLQSNMSKRSAQSGQTPTGGVFMSMTALESNEDCFDLYGECDQRKAHVLVQNEYLSKETESDRQAHKRQYPECDNDMLDYGGRGTTFDNARLAVQFREAELEISSGILPYTIGNLRWSNSIWEGSKEDRRPTGVFSGVYMEELSEEDRVIKKEASIKFFQSVPASFLNVPVTRDLRDEGDGALIPDPDSLVVAAFDPTDYALKKDVAEFSLNSGHGGFMYDPVLETLGIRTDEIWFEYLYRHENPDDTLEDVVKIILYTGCRIIIEANKKWLVTLIKKENLHHFLLLKQKDGSIRPYEEGDENNLVNTTTDMINAYVRAIKRHLAKPKSLSDKDMLATIKTLILLKQLMDFDPTNTKKSHTVVSYGYWRLAVESFSVLFNEMRKNNFDDGGAMEVAVEMLSFL